MGVGGGVEGCDFGMRLGCVGFKDVWVFWIRGVDVFWVV